MKEMHPTVQDLPPEEYEKLKAMLSAYGYSAVSMGVAKALNEDERRGSRLMFELGVLLARAMDFDKGRDA